MIGQRHLIECHCILPVYKNKKPPVYHKFPVFSIIDEKTGKVLPKYVNCNNCGITHLVEEICKSTIKVGKEDIKSIRGIDEVSLSLPDKLIKILQDYNSTIDIYEQIENAIENEHYSDAIVIKREIIDEKYHVKLLNLLSSNRFKITSEILEDIIIREN